jgi:hypothetical protein
MTTQRLRRWSWNRCCDMPQCRGSWLPRFISGFFFAIAKRLDRDPSRCWVSLAMWAMGFDEHLPDKMPQLPTDCGWCGKHQMLAQKPGEVGV